VIILHEFDRCVITSKSGEELARGEIDAFDGSKARVNIIGDYSLRVAEDVNLFIYNSVKGECVYFADVESIDGNELVLENLKFISSRQKRNSTRAEILLHYKITHKFGADGNIEKLEKPIDITIINISANGMYIKCDEKFEKWHRFPFVFREAGMPMRLTAEVVRCVYSNRGNKYGCRFVDISEKDADNIYRFVLHEQIEQRRRRRIF